MKDPKTPFCAVPFNVAFTATPAGDRYRDCCSKKPYLVSEKNQTFHQWWNSVDVNNFKKRLMESDEWPEECWSCKVSEDQGGHSYRVAVNEWNVTDYTYPCSWNLQFGNTCNLACWICSERSSNVVFQHKKQAGLIVGEDIVNKTFDSHWNSLRKDILKSYEYHDTVTLTILGGEPLYNPTVKKFLNHLIEKNLAHRTKLEFHTNGTVYPNKILPSTSQAIWKHVCVFLSLDAVGSYAEWLRYGCKWSKVNKTVNQLIEASDYVEIHCTLTVLNINQLTELEDYANQKGCKLRISVTDHPDFMALKSWDLPKESLLLNDKHEKYQIYYDLIGTEPKLGSSDRLINYIRSFDGIRKPLSAFDKVFAEKIGW